MKARDLRVGMWIILPTVSNSDITIRGGLFRVMKVGEVYAAGNGFSDGAELIDIKMRRTDFIDSRSDETRPFFVDTEVTVA